MTYYYRVAATSEVLGAAMSTSQGPDWIARYEEGLGLDPGTVEEFEAAEDPRQPDATTEPAPTPDPDPNGYLLAAMGVFVGDGDPLGLIRGNEVLSRWPSFSTALLQRNWAVARATLAAAYSVETITEGEHDALEGLFADYHIPEA